MSALTLFAVARQHPDAWWSDGDDVEAEWAGFMAIMWPLWVLAALVCWGFVMLGAVATGRKP